MRSDRLKHYQNLFWDSIEAFDAFDIYVVPREFNDREDSLVVLATLLIPHNDFSSPRYTIEMVFHPSVLDNFENSQFFNDDQHVINFLQIDDGFYDLYFQGR